MPLYEYECSSCDKRSEVIQGFNDPPLTECPLCGGEVRKLLSAPAFQFKGTGWYVTDYAGKKSAGGEGKESTAGEAKGDAEGKKSDSAPVKAETGGKGDTSAKGDKTKD